MIRERLGRFFIHCVGDDGVYDTVFYAKLNLNWLDVSEVTSMLCMFQWSVFNGDISLWDVSNVRDMQEMFFKCNFNGDISGWDVSRVGDMKDMFHSSKFRGDISGWQLSDGALKNHNNMFTGCRIPEWHKPAQLQKKMKTSAVKEGFDISDMGNDIDMTIQKQKVTKHSKIYDGLVDFIDNRRPDIINLKKWVKDASKDVIEEIRMFHDVYDDMDYECRALMAKYNLYDVMDLVLIYNQMNDFIEALLLMDDRPWKFVKHEHIEFVKAHLQTIKTKDDVLYGYYRIDHDNHLPYFLDNLQSYFLCANDDEVGFNNLNLNWIDVSHVSDMKDIFSYSKFNGDISLWNVSHVFSMQRMFASSKFDGDISQWNVFSLKFMDAMFAYSEFTGDLTKWNISVNCRNLTYMEDVFTGCPISEKNKPAAFRKKRV